MTDMSDWDRLSGGPCDGQPVWVEPTCWAVVVTRDSDRVSWHRHMIELGEPTPILVAEEAHLYLRVPSEGGFVHTPNGLERYTRDVIPVWTLKPTPPKDML